jgi:signal transduction histidine kinase/CheY-like chemotaxis protein
MKMPLAIQRSIVARRIFSLFVICALIPIGSLAVLSLRQMSAGREEQAYQQLHRANKIIGVAIFEGLDFLPAEMQALSAVNRNRLHRSPGSTEADNPYYHQHFLGLTRFRGGAAGQTIFGTPCPLPRLDGPARKHLDSGQPIVFVRRDGGGPPRMFMALAPEDRSEGSTLLVGEIAPGYLKNLIDYVAPPESAIAVWDSTGAPLFDFPSIPDSVKDRIAAAQQGNSTGRFEWSRAGRTYLANYRSIFLKATYLCDDWTVVTSLSQEEAFVQMKPFARTFLLILLLALLVVLLLSSVQIRRSLVPLLKLREGTRRIHRGEFDSRIEIDSGDEFEELAHSFNTMAEHLGTQFRDLTDTNLRLEREIADRKQAEEQLRQSQKMEALGNLTGGIAHDFNNILTVINGYSRILLQQLGADSPIRTKIEGINDAGERAALLVNRLLTFSRKQVVEPKVVNLNQVISGMDLMLHRLIGVDILMEASLTEDLWNVRVDPGQFEQVVMNLVVNARDAMPSGGKLAIRTANLDAVGRDVDSCPVEKPGKYVTLTVSDTGHGMDETTRSRVFEPFFTTKPQGKGTGLGLSTVFGIVKQNQGHILLESAVGMGATFTIFLPRVEASQEEDRRSEKPAAEDGRGSETLLLAEDEDLVRDLIRTLLTAKGYKVLEARDGTESIEIGRTHQGTIHLLVTDISMPYRNGFEVARELAEIRPGLKTLYLSGYLDDARHDGEEEYPGAVFLRKPFRPEELTRKVREILDG